jgi:hypothetical protein
VRNVGRESGASTDLITDDSFEAGAGPDFRALRFPERTVMTSITSRFVRPARPIGAPRRNLSLLPGLGRFVMASFPMAHAMD